MRIGKWAEIPIKKRHLGLNWYLKLLLLFSLFLLVPITLLSFLGI